MLIFEVSPEAAVLLGPHRTRSGWEVCGERLETGSGTAGGTEVRHRRTLWLRCPDGEGVEELMAGLPCAGRYRVLASGGLVPFGKTLPVAKMPVGPWVALSAWLQAEAPKAVLPGRCQDRVEIRLERSGREEPVAALLMSLKALTAWAESASRLRMARLKFAVSRFGTGTRMPMDTGAADGGPGTLAEAQAEPLTGIGRPAHAVDSSPRALVVGEPPPPAPGQACYQRGRLVLPCGWDFAPPVMAVWVEESLGLPPGAVALLEASGSVELLEQESFAPLSLAAVRRTWRGLGGGTPLF